MPSFSEGGKLPFTEMIRGELGKPTFGRDARRSPLLFSAGLPYFLPVADHGGAGQLSKFAY
jgi:hypothetical protein